jgi:hypothetical protein
MTMNWATQQTASSHAEPKPGLLSAGGVSVAPALAVISTLMTVRPAVIGAANAW